MSIGCVVEEDLVDSERFIAGNSGSSDPGGKLLMAEGSTEVSSAPWGSRLV
jgi:hypothetical protein